MLPSFLPLAAALIAARTAYAINAVVFRFSTDCGHTDDVTNMTMYDIQPGDCRNWEEDGEFLDMASVYFDTYSECPEGTHPEGWVFPANNCTGSVPFAMDDWPTREKKFQVCSKPGRPFLSVGFGCCPGDVSPGSIIPQGNCGYPS